MSVRSKAVRWVVAGVAAAAVTLAVAAASPGTGAAGLRRPSAENSGAAAAMCGRSGVSHPRYRHVIWIWFENHSYEAVIGSKDAPFTNRLAAACGLATNYHNVSHPSLPNYIAATSGDTQGIADDCQPSECSKNVQSLFGQLHGRGLTWKAYNESMPAPCALESGSGSNPPGDYAPKHNPAAYYLPLRNGCRQRVIALGTPSSGAFAHALKSNALAGFSFITPNLCNDTHDCPVATGDAWLARWLPAIVSSRAYRSASVAVFITWDEGEGGSSDDCALNTSDAGCHVPLLVVAPSTPRGARSALLFNHYSLLKTTEQLLGVKAFLGHANDSGSRSLRPAFHL